MERLSKTETSHADVLSIGRRNNHRQARAARTSRACPSPIIFREIRLQVLNRLCGVARLLDGSCAAENNVIAKFARQLHFERLGIEGVRLGKIRLRRIGDIWVGLDLHFFCKAQNFSYQCLLAFGRKDAGGFGLVNRCRLGKFFLLDQGLRFEEHRLETPIGLRKIRHQHVG